MKAEEHEQGRYMHGSITCIMREYERGSKKGGSKE